jgi:hypothetical protein
VREVSAGKGHTCLKKRQTTENDGLSY